MTGALRPPTRGVRILDRLIAAGLLVVASPVLAVAALTVRLSSRGPVLHRSVRVGQGGRPITVLKLRSMRVTDDGPAVTASYDDRITPVGRFLRNWKLDELPQLINVVRGDMSLVGPRPEDPRYVAHYDDRQRKLLTVPPGITSPATLAFRHEEQILAASPDVEHTYLHQVLPAKLDIDLEWLDQRSVLTDLRVIARTLAGVLTRPEPQADDAGSPPLG